MGQKLHKASIHKPPITTVMQEACSFRSHSQSRQWQGRWRKLPLTQSTSLSCSPSISFSCCWLRVNTSQQLSSGSLQRQAAQTMDYREEDYPPSAEDSRIPIPALKAAQASRNSCIHWDLPQTHQKYLFIHFIKNTSCHLVPIPLNHHSHSRVWGTHWANTFQPALTVWKDTQNHFWSLSGHDSAREN